MLASISATRHPSLCCCYYSYCGLKNKEFWKTVNTELRHCPSEAIKCWIPAQSFSLPFNLFPHSKCTYINWGKEFPFCITNSCIFQHLLAKRSDQMKCADKSTSAMRNGNRNVMSSVPLPRRLPAAAAWAMRPAGTQVHSALFICPGLLTLTFRPVALL